LAKSGINAVHIYVDFHATPSAEEGWQQTAKLRGNLSPKESGI